MRIGLPAVTSIIAAALAAALPLLLASAGLAQQATPDANAAVNQLSPATEKILQELRVSQPEPDAQPAEPVPASDAAAVPNTDGALAQPATDAPNTDGQLRAAPDSAPVDGDMAGDGKLLATPAEASQDPLVDAQLAEAPTPSRRRANPTPRRDARAAAGRSRPVVDEAPVARPLASVVPANDAAAPDVGNDRDAADAAVPTLRPQIVAEDDENPYAPVGYRIGGFKLMPSISAETVYSDNIRQSLTGPVGGVALQLRPAFTLESDWSRHFVSVELRGMASKDMRLGDENNRELNLNVNGRYDIREGTSVEGEAAYELGKIPHSDPNLPAGATLRPSTTTATVGTAINYKINRLAMRLHGAVADSDQGDTGSGDVKFRDGTADARATYELSPSLSLVGSAKRVGRAFDTVSFTDAVANDVRLGIETDPTAKLSGVFSLGLARVVSANPAFDAAGGWVGNASVIWLPSALTTLTFEASSDLGVTDALGATAIRTNKVSLDLKHDIRRWLTVLAGLSETHRSYPGLTLVEDERAGHLGLEYDLSRSVVLTGDLKRLTLASTDPAKGYAEDQVLVGVRLQK